MMRTVASTKAARIPEVNDTRLARVAEKRNYAMTSIRGDAFGIFNIRTVFWTLAFLLACILSSNNVQADGDPGAFYPNSLSNDPENLRLVQMLRQLTQRGREIDERAREITEEEIAIEGILEAKAGMIIPPAAFPRDILPEEEVGEPLPVPSAIIRPIPPRWEKRGSYMALCHFKICNMGRKRQSLSQIRPKIRSLRSWISLGPRTISTLPAHRPIS
ncbi:uncharacterized protein LOC107224107 isoform X1 [Neodiprion lecontei]|uniref:Uncharacterized protein LOC107224107 isoform X1 n=2 Tax=Neodiprion lecontei TaxID=441921 RepID=A0ABM3FK97_NEOLC|nr:uncharacterized protein LOC107224107 isoform X1 [Neodiprion lecontei]XP_046588443.1 uncharacterized protein LOC107224107 isoform X1 [Neodiprion lecontei]